MIKKISFIVFITIFSIGFALPGQQTKTQYAATTKCDVMAVNIHNDLLANGASHQEAYETSEAIRVLCEVLNR